ncbi:MAG: sulfatase [Bacteroidia bacterium]|nr:sulfatase [Bacteroidia bacterium]
MKIFSQILLLGLLMASCTSEEPVRQPNVLFILVDDLGLRDLGYTGSSYYETPNIDRLASRSMIFTQGYAGSRVCSPARATLMTGKFTARHGITDWIGAESGESWRDLNRHDHLLPAEYQHQLPQEEITLAESLKANGYRTFFAGKWHLGDEGSYPEDHGFDINKGGWEKGSPNGGYFSPFQNPKLENRVDGENLSMRLANETADFIRQAKESPFFAMLSFYAVHGPIQTTQEKWAKYQAKAQANGVAPTGFVMERKLPIRQTQDNPVYGGLIESVDDAVGIVLDELERLGLAENTIILFTSDNGGVASGDAFSTSNLPFRGGKGYQWEAGIRAPYLIFVPWQQSNGQQSDYPVTGADFYPTILDYTNCSLLTDQHHDGISLRSIIDEGVTPAERPLYWHYPHYGNQGGDPSSIIREGKWKLIHYYEDDSQELYDLDKDPYEQTNVAANFPDIRSDMSQKLTTWLTEVQANYPQTDDQFDPQLRSEYEESILTTLLPRLERVRSEMLSEAYSPNEDWWGSQVTQD